MADPEFVATIEAGFIDPLSPSAFSKEIVEYLGQQEDLEGDDALIQKKVQAGIENTIKGALAGGHITADSDITMNFAIRDPHEGDVTLLFQTQAKIGPDGEIVIENSTPAHVVDENLDLVNTSFSASCASQAAEIADKLVESIGLDNREATADFAGENPNNYTYSIQAFDPTAP